MGMAERGSPGLSFGEIAVRYDRFRPGVPTAALDWLLPEDCETVVDLAAGTGAMTSQLVDRVRHVVAIEPDPQMRETLARNCPKALLLPGTAERMPLPDGRADALLTSMAWQWFDPLHAVPEIARVLRGGGTFGVLWNHRDLSVPWVAELDRFTRALRVRESGQGATGQTPSRIVADPPTGSLFSPLAELRLTWSMAVTPEEIVGLMGTDASAIALPAEAQHAVDEQVARYVHDELALSAGQTIELPMACRCLRTTKNLDAAP
ncbi:class I SAM-dependent methyltransferase [Streptomyces coacervatus]|uniref:Class I SAM-dependent methyltransferase n=1 Tax=Streptomyces coacervatus TaxID=647381 RepID=A0ABP7H3V7_9ACTN|nr:class I SAM-dependent methyltransferase [Streptomyces coacervatus]MDF2271593.1 class I SAM-dependent methyltransferase [Streptomyces coacervatus]